MKRDIKMAKKKMTEKEIQAWNDLYEYVRSTIMGYDKKQALPSTMALRLKGLLKGKFIENYNVEDKADYSYEVILNTFKYCGSDIQRALRTKSFNREMDKFNYVLKIVENSINDVYLKMKSVEKAKEKSEKITLNTVNYSGAEYQRKTKDITNKFLDDLW